MAMSQEFQIAINLIKKFSDILRQISDCPDPECARPLIESVKHPVANALVQVKSGEGPLKEELVQPLTVMVSQMRDLTNFEALKGAIPHLLSLIEKVEALEAQSAEKKEGG